MLLILENVALSMSIYGNHNSHYNNYHFNDQVIHTSGETSFTRAIFSGPCLFPNAATRNLARNYHSQASDVASHSHTHDGIYNLFPNITTTQIMLL